MATAAKSQETKSSGSIFPLVVIPLVLVISILIYKFVMGNPSNFEGGNPDGHPIPGNYLGMIYKGGFIVPLLMTNFLLVIIFSIERFITLSAAGGKENADSFVRKIKGLLNGNDIQGAIRACDTQKGSVANVVKAGLSKYAELNSDTHLDKEQKVLAIQKEVEEATTLEMPMLEKNLSILATIASIATLFGLLGTVMGMIKAFAALSAEGTPDASALATGISEALINTALGISASALAIIAYNYFTGKIDAVTYRIDEAGFSIAQDFASKHK
ncbi:MAG: MotA/TolQ/ExbB proton channel family protein [Saprospiraceae bacterium]|nr:MotA/TolQ/ExbB proton channel family protein [Saprospiraceae bacterium]